MQGFAVLCVTTPPSGRRGRNGRDWLGCQPAPGLISAPCTPPRDWRGTALAADPRFRAAAALPGLRRGDRGAAPLLPRLLVGARPSSASPAARAARCRSTMATGADALCGRCLAEPPAFDRLRAAVAYGEISRKVALKLKYGGRPGVAETMARFMARHLDAGDGDAAGAGAAAPLADLAARLQPVGADRRRARPADRARGAARPDRAGQGDAAAARHGAARARRGGARRLPGRPRAARRS